MYTVVNISDFKIVSLPTLGYMEKLWVKDLKGVKWLLKYPSEKYPSDAVNEKICCEIAKLFNIPFQEVELCVDDEGRLGCLCKNFLPEKATLVHGGRLLGNELEVDTSSPKFGAELKINYTLQLILRVVSSVAEDFIRSVLFDNLVGNIDRHDKNWALIGDSMLAPCFDYGLSFYPTKETETTWFQSIGFEHNGVISFNNLFQNICLTYPDITRTFIEILCKSDVADLFKDIIQNIPDEFKDVTSHQYDFLVRRRDKMVKIWRAANEGCSVSKAGFERSNVFNR